MVRCFQTLVGYHKETVSVCLFCQLIQIGAFTYQLSDDVQVVVGDSFTRITSLLVRLLRLLNAPSHANCSSLRRNVIVFFLFISLFVSFKFCC